MLVTLLDWARPLLARIFRSGSPEIDPGADAIGSGVAVPRRRSPNDRRAAVALAEPDAPREPLTAVGRSPRLD